MLSLPDVQARFAAAVLGGEDESVPAILAGAVSPEERLSIYRANARENFAVALEAAFPAVLRLMGREEFRRMAWAYQRRHPSASGTLFFAGERLPGFLGTHLAGTPEHFLAEMARLEWAAQEAIVAPDTEEHLDLAALADVPPDRYGELRFRIHPAVRFLKSAYPVFRLWEALRAGGTLDPVGDEPAEHGVDIGQGGEAVLVRRHGGGVELQRLPEAEHACLDALTGGAELESALDRALSLAPEFDLAALLQRMARLQVIVGFVC